MSYWGEGFWVGGPARPVRPSPGWPSFCVLFGWSHLPSSARTNSGLPSPGIPGHAPGEPPAAQSRLSEEGWSQEKPVDRPWSRRCNPASAPNGWGIHPLLISEFPLVQVERKAVQGNRVFLVCFRGDILPGQVHFLPGVSQISSYPDRIGTAGRARAQINQRWSLFLSTGTE